MKLREGVIRDERLLDSDVVLGLDRKGELVALEVWDASKRGLLKTLEDPGQREKRNRQNLTKEKTIKSMLLDVL